MVCTVVQRHIDTGFLGHVGKCAALLKVTVKLRANLYLILVPHLIVPNGRSGNVRLKQDEDRSEGWLGAVLCERVNLKHLRSIVHIVMISTQFGRLDDVIRLGKDDTWARS